MGRAGIQLLWGESSRRRIRGAERRDSDLVDMVVAKWLPTMTFFY